MSEEELLYEKIYKYTQECGRTQFVKLLQQNQIKIDQLQQELSKKNKIIDEIVDIAKEFIFDDENIEDLYREVMARVLLKYGYIKKENGYYVLEDVNNE